MGCWPMDAGANAVIYPRHSGVVKTLSLLDRNTLLLSIYFFFSLRDSSVLTTSGIFHVSSSLVRTVDDILVLAPVSAMAVKHFGRARHPIYGVRVAARISFWETGGSFETERLNNHSAGGHILSVLHSWTHELCGKRTGQTKISTAPTQPQLGPNFARKRKGVYRFSLSCHLSLTVHSFAPFPRINHVTTNTAPIRSLSPPISRDEQDGGRWMDAVRYEKQFFNLPILRRHDGLSERGAYLCPKLSSLTTSSSLAQGPVSEYGHLRSANWRSYNHSPSAQFPHIATPPRSSFYSPAHSARDGRISLRLGTSKHLVDARRTTVPRTVTTISFPGDQRSAQYLLLRRAIGLVGSQFSVEIPSSAPHGRAPPQSGRNSIALLGMHSAVIPLTAGPPISRTRGSLPIIYLRMPYLSCEQEYPPNLLRPTVSSGIAYLRRSQLYYIAVLHHKLVVSFLHVQSFATPSPSFG
ncbi:hypothetical protein FB451DRAFT_1443470 [Mycena latifolia]|nr:hypothetical protein FB451DRAFT_1443470 [Mycena latifolia]